MTKVAVGIVKHPEKEKYLLVRSTRDFGEYTGYYYPPGGHVGDESIPDALRREFREELSLEISPVRQIAETEGDVKGQRQRESIHGFLCFGGVPGLSPTQCLSGCSGEEAFLSSV